MVDSIMVVKNTFKDMNHEQRMNALIDWCENWKEKLDSIKYYKVIKNPNKKFFEELQGIEKDFKDYCKEELRYWKESGDDFIEDGVDWLYFDLYDTILESTDELRKKPDLEYFLTEFFSYLWYASDRMNQNRMLRCHILLGTAVDLCYRKLNNMV